MSSISDKLSGKAKQTAGKATGDDKLQAEGKAEETKGNLKDKFNDAVDKVSDKVQEVTKKSDK